MINQSQGCEKINLTTISPDIARTAAEINPSSYNDIKLWTMATGANHQSALFQLYLASHACFVCSLVPLGALLECCLHTSITCYVLERVFTVG